MQLKDWIRAARERQGINQTDFGDQLGVVKQAVSHWENGRNECSVSQFLRIAKAAKMNPADLDEWPAELEIRKEGEHMTGWPLSPELLAAMQNTTPEMRKILETQARALLGLKVTHIQDE